MANTKTVLISRVICLCLLAFFIIGSYAMSRPAIDSLFLEHYSPDRLPAVWLMSAFTAALVMTIYNRYNTRYPLLKIFGAAAILSAILLVVCLVGYRYQVPGTVYALYLWKEIYVVLLIEIFWSFSDVVFKIKTARWIYGILLGMGSAGGFLGNLVVGKLAHIYGTASALWWVLPILFICWLISTTFVVFNQDTSGPTTPNKKIPKWSQSFEVVKKSVYLMPLLCLVCVVQVCTSLIDYQFNNALVANYPDVDVRTAIIGKTYAIIDLVAVVLQLLSGTVLKFIGVTGSLLCIPFLIGIFAITFATIPRFLMILATKIASKCLDYSLFRASKEILYIPLKHDEKIQGKALIDILIYRIAKGLASFILIALVYFGITQFAIYLTITLLIVWAVLTYVITKRYHKLVGKEENSYLRSA